MRRTEQADPRVRDIPAGELWVGTLADPHPHVVLAWRPNPGEDESDDLAVIVRLEAGEAIQMGDELQRLAFTIGAPNN